MKKQKTNPKNKKKKVMTYCKKKYNPFLVVQEFLKPKTIILVFLLTSSSVIIAQEYHYLANTNAIIENHEAKTGGIGINYNISNQLFFDVFHYPEIEFYYNFSNKFSVYSSFNFNKLDSNKNRIFKNVAFGEYKPLKNNNYGYTLAGVFLRKNTFWIIKNYEIVVGFSYQKMNIDILPEEPIYSWKVKKVLENYVDLFIQANLTTIIAKNTFIYSVKISTVNFNELINVYQNDSIIDFSNSPNYFNNNFLITSISSTFYRPILKNKFMFKFQFGLSGGKDLGLFLNYKMGLIYKI